MHSRLLDLVTDLESGRLLSHNHLATLNERELEHRDDPAFEQRWMACHARLEHVTEGLTPDARATILRVREQTYRRTFSVTQSPDLAGYVSDDFDLIARALAAELQDPWIEQLLARYLAGELPGADNVDPHD
jgi:hypothetical protein